MTRKSCFFLAILLLVSCFWGCTNESALQTPETTPTESPLVNLETIEQRRAAVESKMRTMMSVLWQVDRPITYSFRVDSGDPAVDSSNYVSTVEPGKVYSGLPYTHGAGDDISFADFGQMQDNGVLRMDKLTAEAISGSGGMSKVNNIARLGNDCADAVYAAWSVASSSATFTQAARMTPKNGCIPVGSYKTVDDNEIGFGTTHDLCLENGEEVMYACYAQLQMADALTRNVSGSGAHAMLVADVNVAFNGDRIDPMESYVLVHEQTPSFFKKGVTYYDEALGMDVYVMGGVDRKFTFQKLFNAGYLPVTCKEFIDSAPLVSETVTDSEAGKELSFYSMFDGTLTSNYWIVSVTAEILDESGSVIQQGTCYSGESRNTFQLTRFNGELEQSVMSGTLRPFMLERGNYTLRISCRLSTGAEFIVRTVHFER